MGLSDATKWSEFGYIPADWDILPIEELAQIKNGLTYSPSDLSNNGTLVLRSSNIQDDRLSFINNVFVNCGVSEKHKVEEGDILICVRNGSRNLIGKCTLIDEKADGEAFGAFMAVLRSDISDYLIWQFRSSLMQKQISEHLGATINQITNSSLKAFKVVLPSSTKERKAIAKVLNDADVLIASLEKLIKKKSLIARELRRHLIPESLGNITSGTFIEATIEELVDCLDNDRIPLNNTQRSKMRGNIPYCGANGILDYIDQYIFDDDIILLAEDGGHFYEFETRPIAYQMSGKCWVNNHAHILRAKQAMLNDYIFHALVHKDIVTFLVSGTRTKLNKSELLKITILVPRNADEANRIGQILNEANDEITSLITKLNKAKKIKAAMMQELLTGRTRLI